MSPSLRLRPDADFRYDLANLAFLRDDRSGTDAGACGAFRFVAGYQARTGEIGLGKLRNSQRKRRVLRAFRNQPGRGHRRVLQTILLSQMDRSGLPGLPRPQQLLWKASVLSLPDERIELRSGPRILRDGFVLQAANPKALLFFTAILPQFIDAHHNVAFQILVLGISSIVVEFVILPSTENSPDGHWPQRATLDSRRLQIALPDHC